YPTRAIGDNLADLDAQFAANQRGAAALSALADEHGPETLARFRDALADLSERLVRTALQSLGAGRREAVALLDDGSQIRLAAEIDAWGGLTLDFQGTSPTHPGNLNAPPAVT